MSEREHTYKIASRAELEWICMAEWQTILTGMLRAL